MFSSIISEKNPYLFGGFGYEIPNKEREIPSRELVVSLDFEESLENLPNSV